MPPDSFATPLSDRTDVYVRGKRLLCLICGEGAFGQREIKLNTTGMSFMGLDWANKSGVGAICRTCGYVHTFLEGSLEWRAASVVEEGRSPVSEPPQPTGD